MNLASEKIKCLLVAPDYSMGGEGVIKDMMLSYPPEGVEVNFYKDEVAKGNVSIDWIFKGSLYILQKSNIFTIPMLPESISVNKNYDIIHAHTRPIRVTNKKDIPLIMSISANGISYLKSYLGWSDYKIRKYIKLKGIIRFLGIQDPPLNLNSVSMLVAWSNCERNSFIKHGVNENKIIAIPPGLPDYQSLYRKNYKNKNEKIKFLFAGGSFERKGGSHLLGVFNKLSNEYNNIQLMIVTNSIDGNKIKKNKNVEVFPLMPKEKLLCNFYTNSDIFILPTLAEGFGISIVEAICFGLPVISTTVSSIPEICPHGKCGYLCPPGDIK